VDTFLGIKLEEVTANGNNIFKWEGFNDQFIISISAKIINKVPRYIIYVDLCGNPEKHWDDGKLKVAEASGENIQFLEIEIYRQLKRFENICKSLKNGLLII
jgi:hypothetical protein